MARYKYNVSKPIPVFFIHTRPKSLYRTNHVTQQVTHANGTPVRVNYETWDSGARECLAVMQIQIVDFGHEINIDFQDIGFKCMSPNAPKPTDRAGQIQKCLERMRAGKCPYKLARQLYTGIERK